MAQHVLHNVKTHHLLGALAVIAIFASVMSVINFTPSESSALTTITCTTSPCSITSPGSYTVALPSSYGTLTVTVNGAGGGGGVSTQGWSYGHGYDGTYSAFGSVRGEGGGGWGMAGGGGSFPDAIPGSASGGDTNTTGGGASGGTGGDVQTAWDPSTETYQPTGAPNGGKGGNGGQAVKTWSSGAAGAPASGSSVSVTVGTGGLQALAARQGGYSPPDPGSNGSVTITWAAATAPPPSCGNGVVDSGEQCDGSALGGQSCTSQGFTGGTLSCNASCTFNTSQCTGGGTGNPSGPAACQFTGWAWSDTIGWLSLSGSNYGIQMDASGNVTGYGWSSNIGWVQSGGLSGFPSGSGTQAVNAKLSSGALVGWWRALAGDATQSGGGQSSGTPVTVFLTSGTSWTVPSDWNSSNNTIEVIGGGGGAGGPVLFGGGGGGYSKITDLSLTSGNTITYVVGSGGMHGFVDIGSHPGGNGGDTYFNAATCAAASVCAKGGMGGEYTGSGTGGAAASGVGTVKYSGGSTGGWTGGGGGAAGPHGNGGGGGAAASGMYGGSGGGGNGGGTNGANAAFSGGGNGGNNFSGTGGGAMGMNGTNGGGGGGGEGWGLPWLSGGSGGNGTEWDASHGSGAGGGSAGYTGGSGSEPALNGGNGGMYGGGGGVGSADGSLDCSQDHGCDPNGVGGNGAQGLIVITYTPSIGGGTGGGTGGSSQAGGWDGWISLSGPGYGPKLNADGTFKSGPEFFAWGSDVVGWVDFSLASCTTTTAITCPADQYPSSNQCLCTSNDLPPSAGGTCPCIPSALYSCSGNTIVQTSTGAQCQVTTNSSYATCDSPSFCSAGSSVCLYPSPTGSIKAVPSLVRQGDPTSIAWTTTNMRSNSCSVTGDNHDGTGSNSTGVWNTESSGAVSGSCSSTSPCASGSICLGTQCIPSKQTTAISSQTVYTLSCTDANNQPFNETAVVNIVPVFQER